VLESGGEHFFRKSVTAFCSPRIEFLGESFEAEREQRAFRDYRKFTCLPFQTALEARGPANIRALDSIKGVANGDRRRAALLIAGATAWSRRLFLSRPIELGFQFVRDPCTSRARIG
jgi:hypothetical protein